MNISKILLVPFSALAMVVFSGCEWFGSAEKPKFVIVNVLDKAEYDDAHIKGSIQVPFGKLNEYAHKHWDKDATTIVVHCSNYRCTASGAGAKGLMAQGFKHVYAYEAGTAEALNQGLPMEGPAKAGYLQDFAKPEGYDEDVAGHTYPIISTEELRKLMEEFAAA